MAKKKKKRNNQMPKLSLVDKLIYYVILAVLCVLYVALILLPLQLRHAIAFDDEMVIAVVESTSLLWLLVPWMTFFLMTIILWLMAYQDRLPIFGLRNFKYGPPAWPKKYPLFMKNKPQVWVSERKRKGQRQLAAVLLVILLLSFVPFPLGLYGRSCLRFDGGIIRYNMFNTPVREFSSGEIASLEISTYRQTSGRYGHHSYWGVRVTLETDSGEKYSFASPDFRRSEEKTPYWLRVLLRLKRRYDSSLITYEGLDNLERVAEDRKLTEEETELLYQLFGLEKEA